eukprot:84560-Amphidinium_carterae.1
MRATLAAVTTARAVAAIAAICKHVSPACSAAYVKLLLSFAQMPLSRRQGSSRPCSFCGELFTSALPLWMQAALAASGWPCAT